MKLQKILPPVWLLIAIASMVSLHYWLPIQQLLVSPVNNLGILTSVIGIFIVVYCSYLFKSKQTSIIPLQESSYLITEGIFQYSRNPIYLGMIILLFGVWLYLGSLSPVFIIPMFAFLIQELFIKAEEAMLLERFNTDYLAYIAKVRRWI
jgi:protein-S-isoprenylcysteine O-methyltransferase Ste14